MENNVEAIQVSRLRTLYYWALLLLTLVVLDDLTFGWIFWGLSLVHPFVSVAVALAIYWTAGYWLALKGLAENPGKVASWFLSRLQLERKNQGVRIREQQLKEKVTSVGVAIVMAPLFGGVLTTLWLRRRSVVNDTQARRLAFWLCGLYALEFAVIHGLAIGGAIFFALK